MKTSLVITTINRSNKNIKSLDIDELELNKIGGETEKQISSGQAQRIGITRALYRKPKIIILDEATSGLDSFTESKVLGTINKIKKTIIIVSHRINTLKFCDKVYNIEKNTLKLINKSQLN